MWRYEAQDGEYIGNIWGWRFSIFGAVLILVLLIVAAYTAHKRGKPLFDQRPETTVPASPPAPNGN